MERPPTDTSWLKMEPLSPPWLHPRWTVECHSSDGHRASAERYARNRTCAHFTCTVRPNVRACH